MEVWAQLRSEMIARCIDINHPWSDNLKLYIPNFTQLSVIGKLFAIFK
jgi:hypothetical protein